MKELCFIDIETTGSCFNFHEIIEIGIIKTTHDASNIIGEYETKFIPNYPNRLTEIAQKINGYSQNNWLDAKESNIENWQDILNFWANCFPVCHNPSFERAFITLTLSNIGIDNTELGYHWIGTESLAWTLFLDNKIPKVTLSAIADYFNIQSEPEPHRAINGAELCYKVYKKLVKST